MSQNVFGIQSSLCKTKRTSTLIVLQGLTFEAKATEATIYIYIYTHIRIHIPRDMSLLETADAKELRSIFSSAGNVCDSNQC